MSETIRRSIKVEGTGDRIGFSAILAAVAFAFAALLMPAYAAAGTVTETLDGFSCPGAWTLDPTGPNSSYIRDCGNGWTAYASDTSSPASTSPSPGPIGNQNVVTIDSTANGPSVSSSTLASALINTTPGSARGVLWLLKSYPVQPGAPIHSVKADIRLKISGTTKQKYGLVLFNGIVTHPYAPTDSNALPIRPDVLSGLVLFSGSSTTASDACFGVTAGQWCAWQTIDIGDALVGGPYVVPTAGYVTVGFKLEDTSISQMSYGELDNLTLSDIVTSASSTLPPNDLAQVWKNTYQAPGTDNMAQSADIAVDSAGNSYVSGSSYSFKSIYNRSNYDIVTMKYDDAGNLLWTSPAYDGNSADMAVANAIGPSGNIYVLGRSYILNNPSNVNDPVNQNDYVVIKYDPTDGHVLWSQTYDHNLQDDVPTSLAVDSSGVYVTGSTCGNATACDYFTIKINPNTGAQVWEQIYNGTAPGNELDKAVSVKLDVIGNVYVTGTSTGQSDDIVTIKYDSNGNMLWEQRYESGFNDRASAFGVDSAGNSYVAGVTYAGGVPIIIALKYDSSGNQQWAETYSGSTTETLPSALALDGSGSVYITGKAGRVLDHDIATVKFLSDGTIAWAHLYGNAGFDDWGADIAVDSSGNTYVLGALTRSAGNTDFVTVKYDATGAPISAITYDGFNLADTPSALVLRTDSQGDAVPYITGTSTDVSGLNEISVVRYTKSRPDLTITSVVAPISAMAGSSITVNDTVLNIKDLAAKKYSDSGPFVVGYYLAPGGSGLADLNNLTLLGTRSVSNLVSGASSAAATALTIPVTQAEGVYYLVAIADANGDVTEADETNNTAVVSTTLSITGSMPDLAVTSFSGPVNVTRDVPFNVTTTVSNLTSAAAGSFRVGIYLSTDPTITTGDSLIGSRTIASLAGLATNTATTSVTVPSASFAAGTYYLGVIADDQGAVAESNESNNTATLGGSSNSTLITNASDFVAGLPGTNVAVLGKGNTGHVQLAQSSVVWTAQSSWNVGSVANRATPAPADLNGDGRLDLMIGSFSGVTYGYRNTGTVTNPSWIAEPTWDVPMPTTACGGATNPPTAWAQPAIGDMNGDGIPDIMLVGYRYGICAFQNTGTQTAPVWTRNAAWDVPAATPTLSNKYNAPTLADLNGDGKLDLMIGQSFGNVFAYMNTGTTAAPVWTYTSAWNYVPSGSVSFPRPYLVDMDGDGKRDLMVGLAGGNVFGVRNTGTLTAPAWTETTAWDLPVSGSYASPAIVDLDNDGRKDMLFGDVSGVALGFRNTGPYYANTGTPDGQYTSKVIDAGSHGGFTTLSYVTLVPSGTSLSVDIRAGNTPTPDASWASASCGSWCTGIAAGGDISVLGTNRYVQYRVNLVSTNVNLTPALYSIQANTSPAPATATPVAVVVGSGGGGGDLGITELLFLSLAGLLGGARRWRRVQV